MMRVTLERRNFNPLCGAIEPRLLFRFFWEDFGGSFIDWEDTDLAAAAQTLADGIDEVK